MKRILILSLVAMALAGCAQTKIRFVNYHHKCEAINPEPADFVAYVGCMNATLNGDPVTKETSGATKYLTLANRYKDRVLKGEMKSEDASFKLRMDYVGIVTPGGGGGSPSGQSINVNATVINI